MVSFPKRVKGSDMSGVTIGAMYGHTPVKGDVGLEIEVEGNKFPKNDYKSVPGVDGHLIPPMWKYVKDGSLRGADNAEYILNGPIPFDRVEDATERLFKMFKDYGTILDDSNRTSVHVHLNIQNFHLNRLATFLAIYYSVEELLTEFCGEHRVGNLFCLRGKDAPGIVSRLRRFIRSGEKAMFSDGMHYGALNAQSIQKFGSLEIRTMRGALSPNEVNQWVAILQRIYELSGDYPDPRLLVDLFSGEGPNAFLDLILGEHRTTVTEAIGFDHQRVMESMYEGIRMAQDIAYCRDWSEFKALDIKPDPFGRSLQTVVAGLTANGEQAAEEASPYSNMTIVTNSSFSAYAQAAQAVMNPFAAPVSAPAPAPLYPTWEPAESDIEDIWIDEMPEWFDEDDE